MSRIFERCGIFASHDGDVAQLARALDWQSRGRRFEPDLLHSENEALMSNDVSAFFMAHIQFAYKIGLELDESSIFRSKQQLKARNLNSKQLVIVLSKTSQ